MGILSKKKKDTGIDAGAGKAPHPRGKRSEMRYVTERKDARSEAQCRKMLKDAEDRIELELGRLQRMKNRAQAMAYFDSRARFNSPRLDEIRRFREGGGKVVGTFCHFVPGEIITAAGCLPVRLDCGFYEFIQPANDLLGDAGLCPLVRSTIGSALLSVSPYLELCDMVVSPAPCDAKLKMAEVLQDYVPVHIMNIPRAKNRENMRRLWLDEIVNMKRAVEDFTGSKVLPERLKTAIKTYQAAQHAWRRFSVLRTKGNLIWGRDALLVSWLSFVDDISSWTRNVELLEKELEGMLAGKKFVSGDDAPRIMLAGSPFIWPNWKLPHIIEDARALIVCDELCSGMRVLHDPVVVAEWTERAMLSALAERYLFPCTCPCFTPNLEREENILQRVKEFKADGVILHVLKGCHLTSFDATKTTKFLRANDIPVLKIESEYDVGDVGQIKIRVEAFIEMIEAKKGLM